MAKVPKRGKNDNAGKHCQAVKQVFILSRSSFNHPHNGIAQTQHAGKIKKTAMSLFENCTLCTQAIQDCSSSFPNVI